MRGAWSVSAIVIFVACCYGFYSSQPVSNQEQRKTEQKIASDNHAAPQNLPTVVNLQSEASKTDDHQREANEATVKAADAAVAYTNLTFCLLMVAALQALLFLYQLSLMQRNIEHAKTSADAALESAKVANTQIELTRAEFNSTHRSRIRIKHVWITRAFWTGEKIQFSLVIVNTGDASARITDIRYGEAVFPIDHALPQKPEYAEIFRNKINIDLEPGQTWEFSHLESSKILSDDENGEIRATRKKLYIYGHIEYAAVPRYAADGVIAKQFIKNTAFCRVLERPIRAFSHIDMGRLVRHNDPDYEYED